MKNFLDKLKEIKNNKEISHYKFKNVYSDLPNWDAFTEYIEFSKTAGNYRSDSEGFYILHTDAEVDDLSKFPNIKDFKKYVTEMYEDENLNGVGLTFVISEYSINDQNKVTGIVKHFDDQDTIHLGCIGRSSWKIFDKDDNIVDQFLIEPGDILFTRQGTTHEVFSLDKRAACILSMDKDGAAYK